MHVKQLCELRYFLEPLPLPDYLPGDGHLGEDVPQDDANNDVVAEVEYDALTVLFDVLLYGLRRCHGLG